MKALIYFCLIWCVMCTESIYTPSIPFPNFRISQNNFIKFNFYCAIFKNNVTELCGYCHECDTFITEIPTNETFEMNDYVFIMWSSKVIDHPTVASVFYIELNNTNEYYTNREIMYMNSNNVVNVKTEIIDMSHIYKLSVNKIFSHDVYHGTVKIKRDNLFVPVYYTFAF